MDRSKIIDKLKKMMKHATSAEKIGSEAEAAAFAAMIQKMIAQHNIDKAELSAEDLATENDENPITEVLVPDEKVRTRKGRRIAWMDMIADAVAYAHFCQLLVSHKTTHTWFCGRRTQAEMAAEVFAKLVNAAESIADKEYVVYFYECKRAGDVTRARGFRGAFLDGFAARMRARYLAWMAELDKEAARKSGAMVLFKSERDQVREYLDEQFAKPFVKQITSLTEFFGVDHQPVVIKQFRKGSRFAIVQKTSGRLAIIELYFTHVEATNALLALLKKSALKPKKEGKYHAEGRARGSAAANKIDLGEKKQDDFPLPKE